MPLTKKDKTQKNYGLSVLNAEVTPRTGPVRCRPGGLPRTAARFNRLCCFTISILCLMLLLSACSPSHSPQTNGLRAHHNLRVTLIPETHRLTGRDDIEVRAGGRDILTFALAEKAAIGQIKINGESRSFTFRKGQLRIPLKGHKQGDSVQIRIEYTCVFDDPVPAMPVSTDNPGYGVTGTISENGILLLGGAGWYPRLPRAASDFEITVTAPAGILAITAGQSRGHETKGGKTVSAWTVRHPVEALALSAGPYIVDRRQAGAVGVATWFFPETRHLSEAYLTASAKFITLYEETFGPYPFDQFAVVENFFPTGYGFPSYTLMGSRVLRLPFIRRTSLGHEIAHCWWGNGVHVDDSGGNWCEGLTTYVSDYLYKERMSEAEARNYRLQMLRNYAALVGPQNDFPPDRFRSRYDRVTKVVGYDKVAMIFHMLRRQLGEKIFWGTLRDIYRDNQFKAISWADIQQTFERRSGQSLMTFFDQWVHRKGAAKLALRQVSFRKDSGQWTIRGQVVQEMPVYDLHLSASVETDVGALKTSLKVAGEITPFELRVAGRPTALHLDPEADVFRQLYPSEIPPSVNSLKGSSALLVVIAGNAPPQLRAAARLLVRSLGVKNCRIISEERLNRRDLRTSDLILVGIPEDKKLLARMPDEIAVRENGFTLNRRAYHLPTDALFSVFGHPAAEGRITALFLAAPSQAETIARKITHYGPYSYLTFADGRNQDKGVWPVKESPLIHRF